MDEDGLQARAAHLDVVYGAARRANALQERWQFSGDVGHPGAQHASVLAVDVNRVSSGERRHGSREPQRDETMPPDRAIDQFRQRA